jgi:lipoprotein-anchoring transpeptidase ErfK/SrfK
MTILQILSLFLILSAISPITARGESRKITNLCRVVHPGDAAVAWDCRRIRKGETPEALFGDRWLDVLRFNRIDRRHLTAGVSIRVPRNLDDIEDFSPLPDTYPPAAQDEKFILVDLTEQFLGAYEYGEMVFSFPVASGNRKNRTPVGDFRITAFNRRHRSSLYKIEKTNIPYPMHYALLFFSNERGVRFWIHGRDLPGFPASHGCIGLYDEEMQQKYYRFPQQLELQDSRTLYEWVIGAAEDDGTFTRLKNGPRVRIIGRPPL